ncbi:hypothetical protein AQUSIP_08040 [Aquicella siphonis]|uniref:Outer membrane protein assembly factor BamE domain-containing protein n=1 Tax=Aquicella siphonis TaxID=254247 RepID=A0A5E4PF96_9COXI|nr:outer membrane protein assembly factor BamE [Aquicella siphonis]VVC75514.1 hypothetical protein AQUSIP_08040 [Aquicella siphonis]
MRLCFATVLFIVSMNAFAIFCPSNFSQVRPGDTIDQVLELCGKPDSQNSYNKTASLSEEWSYYVKSDANDKTTSKMTVVFSSDKVININVVVPRALEQGLIAAPNGKHAPVVGVIINDGQTPQNVASTRVCGSLISIGDSVQQVESACGKPAAVRQNQPPGAPADATIITELKYGGTTPATLLFENGILIDRV